MFGSSGCLWISVDLSLLEFVKKDNNGLLLATAVISGAMLLWPFVRRSTGGPWVTIAQATHLINRSEEHTSELQSRQYLVCRLLLEKKKRKTTITSAYTTHR